MKRFRRGLAAVAAALAVAAIGVTVQSSLLSAAASPAAPERNPVILVHGLFGSPGNWSQVTASLQEAGYAEEQIVTFGYNSISQSNAVTAEKLGAKVDEVLARTGSSKVDIVGHSMGSLNSRYCIKYAGCAGKVDDWVSLAGPNNGVTSANLCWWQITCREMRIGSTFITKLNTVATLPGDVQGTVIWSPDDGVVTPATSSVLDGVHNIEVAGVRHIAMLTDDKVAGLLADALA
ncbi:Triacylglycerol esterase/lipase EstA, alpha/beta hydrolase fold [Amycolatopsis marina]|uniref:Triacylglycerol esterase/lipase EstA, alpha/beta hydrolase fold n=1 Tax=Amycolatopsis marina TaxID=490629 RepID=A0A1I0V799_9PSEU|nr:triacylglycerol lipase [Amycolatopsis marina]SFA72112.1 Triacylglycerol esterase/lipase EstA, alpha/beta hydrolase fold [Amycolatopsis marina]